MTSTLGRNVYTCSQHFSSTASALLNEALLNEAPKFMCELIMLRQGILAVPEVCVSNEDMRHCIVSVCTS